MLGMGSDRVVGWSVCLFVGLSVCLFVCLYDMFLFVCLLACLFVCLLGCVFVFVATTLLDWMIGLFACLCVVCLFVRLG